MDNRMAALIAEANRRYAEVVLQRAAANDLQGESRKMAILVTLKKRIEILEWYLKTAGIWSLEEGFGGQSP